MIDLPNELIRENEVENYNKPVQMQFQKNATGGLLDILKDNSRAFLADEAGLGKTYSATGVLDAMAYDFWKDGKNDGKPFIAIYVGPNTALLKKCCDDIVSKSQYEIVCLTEKDDGDNKAIETAFKNKIEEEESKRQKKINSLPKDRIGIQNDYYVKTALERMSPKFRRSPFISTDAAEKILEYYKANQGANERSRIKNAFNSVKSRFWERNKEIYLDTLYSIKKEEIEERAKEDIKNPDNFKREYGVNLEKKKNKLLARKAAYKAVFGNEKGWREWNDAYENALLSSDRLSAAYDILVSNNYLNQKKIILIPLSSNLLGYSGTEGSLEERDIISKYSKKIDAFKSNLEQRYKMSINSDDIKSDKAAFALDRGIMEMYVLSQIQPKLVIWDEYHRYFDRVSSDIVRRIEEKDSIYEYVDINSLRWYEESSDMKALFLSATPYKNNISGKEVSEFMDSIAEEQEIQMGTLPQFKEFAKLFYQGKGLQNTPVTDNQPGEKIEGKEADDLVKANDVYTEAINNLTRSHSFDEDWKAACRARNELQNLLSKRMIRHERTMMNFCNSEQHKLLYDSQGFFKDEYKIILKNTWNQMNALRKYNYPLEAVEWSKNMPWLLTFSTRYKSSGQINGRSGMGYFKSLMPTKELGNCLEDSAQKDVLFLYGSNLEGNKISSLPEQNIAFYQMCGSNVKEEMVQLIWMPPTVPIYSVSQESIFHKQRKYSKLLVFGEYKYLQRGGSLLLSEYAEYLNRTNADFLKEKDFRFPELKYGNKAEELSCIFDIYDSSNKNKNLDEIISGIVKKISDANTETCEINKKSLAAIAAPAVCAKRLGLDAEAVENSFNDYFNKQGVQEALRKWMEINKITDLEYGLLRYCAEGNLLAVLEEWKMCNNNVLNEEYIETILNYEPSIVHVQTLETKWSDGLPKQTSFADRLTFDHRDVGTATGKEAEKWHAGVQRAFNSPFWPMVLFAGRGAQEGFDFHSYCLRIMHLTLPRGAVSFDQRQGRIDRFRSLLVRRRVGKMMSGAMAKDSLKHLLLRMFATLVKLKSEQSNSQREFTSELFPNWQVGEDNENYFERLIAVWDLSSEKQNYDTCLKLLNSYRSSFGSMSIMEDIIGLLLDKHDDEKKIKDILLDLSAKEIMT